MTDSEPTDLSGDFEAGRAQAFKDIRAALHARSEKYAYIAVTDFFNFGLNKEEATFVAENIASPFLSDFRTHVIRAIDMLKAGHSVLTLTGQDEIKKYKHITSGDYDAGARSAAEDLKTLVGALDLNAVIEKFMKRLDAQKELLSLFVDGDKERGVSAYLDGEGPERKGEQVVRDFLGMMIANDFDGVLLLVENRFLQKAPVPHIIGYDGEEPSALKFRFLHVALNHMYEPMNRITRMKGHIPTSWPPFKVQEVFNTEGADLIGVDGPVIDRDTYLAQQSELAENHAEDFQSGFRETLENFYLSAQKLHFGIYYGESYNEELGVSDYWKSLVTKIVEAEFSALRLDVHERLNDVARGEGDTYQDGRQAAMDWVLGRINVIQNEISTGDDKMTAQRVVDRFKEFWKKNAMLMIVTSDRPESSVVAGSSVNSIPTGPVTP
jgi:hypothetical protein